MPRRKKGSSAECGKSGSINKGKPQQRNAANARERARMRVLSRAFCRLKTTLPWVPADTKLSKLDTLRLAGSYIAHLKKLLNDPCPCPNSDEPSEHPAMTLTWPFGFNRPNNVLGEGNGSCSVGGGSEESNAWDPESPRKDCVHLEQSDLLDSKQAFQMHLQESGYKCHPVNSDPSDIPSYNNNNNNNLSYNNFHQNLHSNIPCFQSDILSMS